MARSITCFRLSSVVRQLAAAFLLLSSLTLDAQSYQSSFSEVKYDRAKTPSGFHGVAEVDIPSGAVNINIPLGPGIGARGAEFRPHLSGRMSAGTRHQLTYKRRLKVVDGAPWMNTYQSEPTWVTIGVQDNNLFIGPGGLDMSVMGMYANNFHGVRWTGPDGTSGSGTPLAPRDPAVPERVPGGLDFLALLSHFRGYEAGSGWDLCKSTRSGDVGKSLYSIGSQGELIFPITHPSQAPVVTLPAARLLDEEAYSENGVAWPVVSVFPRIAMIRGDVLYVYEFREAEFLPTQDPTTVPRTEMVFHQTNPLDYREFPPNCYDQNGQLKLIDLEKLHYRLLRIVNKFGDEIAFTYDRRNYTAQWKMSGDIKATIAQTVNYSIFSQYNWSSNISYSGTTVPESYEIQCGYMPESKEGNWRELKRGAFFRPSEINTDDRWITQTPHQKPEYPLSFTGVTSVTCLETQEKVMFEYGLTSMDVGTEVSTNQDPDVPGFWFPALYSRGPRPFQLNKVITPGKTMTFSWAGGGSYRRNVLESEDSFSGFLGYVWNDAWPASSFLAISEVVESAGGSSRITKYARTLPQAAPAGSVTPWISTTFRSVVTHPDNSTTAYTFASPLNNGRNGTPQDGSTLSEKMQTLAHLKHLIVEIRDYASGVDWTLDKGNPSSASTAHKLTVFDRWDVRTLGNPTGDLKNGSVPFHTRTRTWSIDNGVVEEVQKLDWDDSNRGWKTNRRVLRSRSEANLDNLEFLSLPLQNAVTPSYPAPRAGRNETLTLSSVPSKWIWGRTDVSSTTTYDGVNTLSLPTTTNYWEMVNGFSRPKSIDTNTSLTTTFSYPPDQSGPKIAQRETATLSSNTLLLSNQVGVSQYTYNPFGFLSKIKPMGVNWSLGQESDAFGRVTSQTRADTLSTAFEWGPGGRLKKITPPGELPTEYIPDPDFLGVTIKRGVQESHLQFNGFGELIRESRKGTSKTSHRDFGYDLGGRKVWETVWLSDADSDRDWNASASTWDTPESTTAECVEWQLLPNLPKECLEWYYVTTPGIYSKQISRYLYDNRGRPWRVQNPNGDVVDTVYDLGPAPGIGLISQKKAYTKSVSTLDSLPSGEIVTTFEKDTLGRLTKVTDPSLQVTQYQYDPADRLTKVVQWSGPVGTLPKQERTWVYNDLGWLVALSQPESGLTTYSEFDVTGKPWMTNYNGRVVRSTRDTVGHVESVQSMNSGDISVSQTFSWGKDPDIFGNKLKSANANGVLRILNYSPTNGKVCTLTRTLDDLTSFTQSIGYDTYGRINSRVYPDGKTQLMHNQDLTDLPDTTSLNGSTLANLQYDDITWNLKQLAYTGAANGASNSFTYRNDQVGLSSMTQSIPAKSLTKVWTYGYDGAGRLLTDKEDSYTYDLLGRLLTAAVVDLPTGSKGLFQTFGYDAFGNRTLAKTETASNWTPPGALPPTITGIPTLRMGLDKVTANTTFNAADGALLNNQMPSTMTNGAATGAHYDNQGNLDTVYTTPSDSTTQVSLTYDALARVSKIISKAGTEEYLHDDEGLRIKVVDSTGKIRYNIYNEARQLIAQYEKVGTGPLTWKKDIVYVGTKEIAEVNSDGKTYITMCDHLGSPRFIWSGGSDAVIKQKFLPFGESLTPASDMAKIGKGFTNHEQTDASGLIYMQARFYLPMWGRFASPDPARDQHFEETQSWNIYSYVQNSPTMMIDPNGMKGEKPAATIRIYSVGIGGISGHSWVSISVEGKTTTYGTWGNHPDGQKNGLIKGQESGYAFDVVRSADLDEGGLKAFNDVVSETTAKGEDAWSSADPCSSFAQEVWERSTGEKLEDREYLVSTPSTLKDSIKTANGGKAVDDKYGNTENVKQSEQLPRQKPLSSSPSSSCAASSSSSSSTGSGSSAPETRRKNARSTCSSVDTISK